MGRLDQPDLRRLLAFIANARVGSLDDPIPAPLLIELRDLLGATEAEYFELRIADRATMALTASDEMASVPGTEEAMARFGTQNPTRWLQWSPADGPQRLSARVRRREFARREWYTEFMRPNGLTDILKVWLWRSPESIACIQLWRRGGQFTRRDQDMLGVLQQDLIRWRAMAMGREGRLEHLGDGLTAREAEVLVWAVRGHAREAIAARLGLSPRTVAKHLERAYEELGVRSRAEVVDRLLLSGRAAASPDDAHVRRA